MDNRMPKKKMKINSNIKALKSGVWYTIGNFIVKAMGFISMPIFTRIMSPEAVGDFSNFTSWVAILGAIATADLYSSVWMARFDYRDELNDYIASNLVLGSTITICFYAIALLFKRFFLKLFCFSELELHTAFVYFMVYPALQMFQVKSRIEYKYKTSVMLSISSALISTGVSLICVILTEHKLIGRLMGYYVPLIFLNGALYIYMLKRSNKISCQYWRYGLTISLPMVLHTLSGSLLGSSDRVMIKHMCGSSATAFYSIAYSCAMIVSVLWMSLNSAWSPWAYEKMNEKDFIMLKRASKPYILFLDLLYFVFF